MTKRKEKKTFTCACGCGETFLTARYDPKTGVPARKYKDKAHANRVYARAHPRQKIGPLTEITINQTRYRLVPVER